MHKGHQLKTWPLYFRSIWQGKKQFEIRKNDRGFAVGDILHLREWGPGAGDYTGRWIGAQVTYMIQGEFGLPDDVSVMSIDVKEKHS